MSTNLVSQDLHVPFFTDEVAGLTRVNDVQEHGAPNTGVRVFHAAKDLDHAEMASRSLDLVVQGETVAAVQLLCADHGFSTKRLTTDAKGPVNTREMGLSPQLAYVAYRVRSASGETFVTDGKSEAPLRLTLSDGREVALTGVGIHTAVCATLLKEGNSSRTWHDTGDF